MKFFFLLPVSILLFFGFANLAFAFMPEFYPIYGYNQNENLCQIKQFSAESEVTETLTGEYWSLRECRVENPVVFLNSGFGIVIWLLIVSLVFISNFFINPRFQKSSKLDRYVHCLFDFLMIGLFVFFVILLEHYFSVPYTYYDYGSDFDHILYANFISSQVPIFYAFVYLLVVLIRIFILFSRRKFKSNQHAKP